jgi:hypothetical protein
MQPRNKTTILRIAPQDEAPGSGEIMPLSSDRRAGQYIVLIASIGILQKLELPASSGIFPYLALSPFLTRLS